MPTSGTVSYTLYGSESAYFRVKADGTYKIYISDGNSNSSITIQVTDNSGDTTSQTITYGAPCTLSLESGNSVKLTNNTQNRIPYAISVS